MNKLRLTEKKRGIRNMGGPYRFAHLAPAALAVLLCAVFWRVLVWPTLSAAEAPMSGNLFHYAPTLASALGLAFLVAFSWKAHRYLDRLRSKRNKQAESLDSGNLLSTVLKNVPDVIYRLDPGGRIVFISDSVRRFGYEPERLVGRHILDLVHPNDVETARYRLNERRTGERGTKALEVRILTKDKDVRQVESRCVAVISVSAEGLYGASLPGADSFLGTQGIARDLTRQKIAEQALAESEAKYRQLYYHAPAGIYEVDIKNACFLTVNDLMCEYTGYSREEFFRLNPIDILTEESLVTFIERINKLKAGENVPADFEVQIKGKNGRVFWVLIHVRYTYEDGVPVRAAVVVHDTTARKEAELALKRSEKALRESEERYRSILENSADGFFMARISDGALVFVNSVLCDLFGYNAEEALKHTIYDFIDPEDHKIINDRVRLRLTGQRPSPARWTYRAIRRDRSVFKAEITVTLVTYNGEPMAQGTLRDVTEQETLQRQLQHSQKMNAVGTLAGGIAHDFNNIIQAIQGYAELIRLKSDPDSDVCQQSRAIEAGAERASELARRLLAFSQKMESQARPIDVNRQVEQVVKLMSRTIPKMIDIEAVPAADLWSAQADPVQVEQVIMNLLVNARDAMPEGGVIVIQTGNVELDELFCRRHIGVREGRYVRLTVGDTGRGMGPETMEHIFEPFFTTKALDGGTGLGLSTVFGIVKKHEGHLTCHSQPGAGTVFHVYLPAAALSSEEEVSPDRRNIPQGPGTGTVLLVDDEPAILETVKAALGMFGYKALLAHSGEEALAVYAERTEKIDVVVMDLGMPGMGGHKGFRALLKIDPRASIIIASGYASGEEAQAILQEGAKDFIPKPYRLEDMIQAIRVAMGETGKAAAGAPPQGAPAGDNASQAPSDSEPMGI